MKDMEEIPLLTGKAFTSRMQVEVLIRMIWIQEGERMDLKKNVPEIKGKNNGMQSDSRGFWLRKPNYEIESEG